MAMRVLTTMSPGAPGLRMQPNGSNGVGVPQARSQHLTANRDKVPGDILYEVMETRLPPAVIGTVSRKKIEYARLWKTAQKRTDKPMKFGGISAQEVEALIVNEFYKDRRALVMDLSSTFNDEYHELADAGCPIIQIEEPAIHEVIGISNDPVMTPTFTSKHSIAKLGDCGKKLRFGVIHVGVVPRLSGWSIYVTVMKLRCRFSINLMWTSSLSRLRIMTVRISRASVAF